MTRFRESSCKTLLLLRTPRVCVERCASSFLWLHTSRPHIDRTSRAGGRYFVVVDGVAQGVCAYLRVVPSFGCIEIGHVAFAPILRRTTAATEAIWCPPPPLRNRRHLSLPHIPPPPGSSSRQRWARGGRGGVATAVWNGSVTY